MGIPLMEGRFLDDAGEHRKPAVCAVDQSFARRCWPGRGAGGQRMTIGLSFDRERPLTVAGAVGDGNQHELTENPGTGSVYLPYSHVLHPVFSPVVRSPLPAGIVAPMIQRAVRQLDPELLIDELRRMQARVDDSLVARRSPAIPAGLFAAIALLLAAVGAFGVLSYAVSQRKHEIGVRMALGARPIRIWRQFPSAGLRLAALGIALGLFGAWASGCATQGILFGVSATDGATLASTAVILGAVAIPACLLQARRAASVDPAVVLPAE